jgi:hypothetical protein
METSGEGRIYAAATSWLVLVVPGQKEAVLLADFSRADLSRSVMRELNFSMAEAREAK